MPHSPRWYDGQLFVLDSGMGHLQRVDLATGQREMVAALPGYARGLAIHDGLAFVGLSRIRETAIFGGVPIAEYHDQLKCGVGVIELATGNTLATLEFTSGLEEIFDVQVVPARAASPWATRPAPARRSGSFPSRPEPPLTARGARRRSTGRRRGSGSPGAREVGRRAGHGLAQRLAGRLELHHELLVAGGERGDPVLELEDPADALDADAGRRQLRDLAEQLDVARRVAATAAAGAAGGDEAHPLVGAQGLRVQAGELGGDADHEDRGVGLGRVRIRGS